MKTAQLAAVELTWVLWRTALNRLDAFAKVKAAIEARDREWVEACEYEALLAGNPCGHDPCSHSTCTTARSAAARIRALIPREDSRG